jgi:hypothetical protein
MLRVLDGALLAIRPTLAMMTSARDMLITDRARAALEGDTTTAGELAAALNELSTHVDDLHATVTGLIALAARMRAESESDATNIMKPREAG